METYLPFRRVGVYVHVGVGQAQVDNRQGKPLVGQQSVVGLFQGEGEHPVLNPTPVHEKGHVGPVGPVQAGSADVALNLVAGFRVLAADFQHPVGHLGPVDRQQGFPGLVVARGGELAAAVGHQLKPYVRVS